MDAPLSIIMELVFSQRTQYKADHGAEVASPTAKVEEGEAGVEIQSLHHLRVDARRR